MGLKDKAVLEPGGLRNLSSIEFSAIPDSVTDHWRFGEGGGTTVANGVRDADLTLTGSNWTSDSGSLDGAYWDPDGVDDVATQDNNDGHYAGLEDFTYFATGYLSDFTTDQSIGGIWETGTDDRVWMLRFREASNEWHIQTSTDGANNDGQRFNVGVSADNWFSVAFTRRASDGQVELFENASSIGTGTVHSGTLNSSTETFYASGIQFGNEVSGRVDNTAFARESVLSQSDIQTMHDLVPRFQ